MPYVWIDQNEKICGVFACPQILSHETFHEETIQHEDDTQAILQISNNDKTYSTIEIAEDDSRLIDFYQDLKEIPNP